MPHLDLSCFPFGSASALVRALRTGQISSVELLKAYLARVDRFNPALNAIVVEDRDAALRQARAADRARSKGLTLGALHGLPMTVKEAFDLTGHASTQGYPEMKGNLATQDALAVQRLKAAGAVIFGKSNVPLNNGDFQSYNDVYGTTNNPWDLTRGPGGSSGGGAAAVAAGLVGMEFGSDIGGSIRNPAAYCGVYGHKSTWRVIPKRGHALARTPVAEADLAVLGPLARSAKDLALALDATVGADELNGAGVHYRLPAAARTLNGLRVAVWLDQAGAEIDDSVRAPIHAAAMALRRAGAKVSFTARPAFDPQAAHGIYMSLLLAQVSARRPDYAQLAELRKALPDTDQSEPAQMLRLSTPSFKEVYTTNQGRERLRWAWHAFFADHDVLLAPVTSTAAFVHDHSEPAAQRTLMVNGHATPYFSQLFWAGLATSCFLPATAAPVGFTAGGLPVGLKIIGPEMADRRTIWVASQLERLVGGAVPPPGYA
jgi:amidase